jgi:hypothetical protein
MQNQPTDSLTDNQLKLSYWYVSHKLLLKKMLMVFLIALSALVWFFVVWQLISYLVNYSAHKQLQNNLLFTQDPSLSTIESEMPKNVSISSVQVYGTENGYDYLAIVTNENKNWLGEFDYRFVNGSDLQLKKGYVLPDSEANIMEFTSDGNSSDFQISNLKWKRVYNYELIKNKMDYFTVDNEQFTIGKQKEPSMLNFELTNNSPYSYWAVDVQVIVYSGGAISGINHSILNQFKSGEKRNVSLVWNHALPLGASYEIIPVVNFLNPENIMPVTR